MSKTIVITGTSTGFGKLTVQTLAKDGHHVFAAMRGITGKNKEAASALEAWAKENNVNVDVIEMDVTSDASVLEAAKLVLSKSETVDVVINNAGIYGGGLSETYTADDYKTMYEVNVFGPVRVNNAFLPTMRKQKSGLLIQISSMMGRFVIPFASTYTSTKFAVEAIAESLRYELAPMGIDSVIVEPGAFATEIFQKIYQPSNSALTAEYDGTLPYLEAFGNAFHHMMSGEVPNQPQQVADAIKLLIDTPAGQRALRTPVDLMMQGTAQPVNAVQEQVQQGFLKMMQLDGLLQTHSLEVEA